MKYERFCEMRHKSMCCTDQVYGMCGRRRHLVEICANVITALTYKDNKGCYDDSDVAISGEEIEVFMCDTPDKLSVESFNKLQYALVGIMGHRSTCLTHQSEC